MDCVTFGTHWDTQAQQPPSFRSRFAHLGFRSATACRREQRLSRATRCLFRLFALPLPLLRR
jgi:hypothetical protein